MAYEEKKSTEDGIDAYNLYKLIKILTKKIWVVVLCAILFAAGGFGVAKLTYREAYSSTVIINVSNKDRDIAGDVSKYVTASDASASATIANTFNDLIQTGSGFFNLVVKAVNAKTGEQYSVSQIRKMVSVVTEQESTLVRFSVVASSPELAYAITTSIQSVYNQVTDVSFPTANFTVADPATESQLQGDTTSIRYSLLGFVAGAALAVLAVLISGRLKNTLMMSEDIKNNYNLSILAVVGKIKSKEKGKQKNARNRLLITDRNVGLPFIETFKLIRTKIENAKLKKGYSVYTVTSSTESEGKTTCSSNIALSLAKTGKSVLLIDCDLRKPAVYKTLGISLENEKGVYDIVRGNKTFEEAVKYVEKYNLYLLVSSSPVSEPSEVLASKEMENIIAEARKNFDYVIVDCPPAGIVADAAIVANYTDSIIFVASEGRVALGQVEYALSDLMTTKVDILGCIYNRAENTKLGFGVGKGGYYLSGYGGYYGSYYGSYYYGSSSGSSHSTKRRHHRHHS